jgi:hypothetical protein
MQNIFQCFNRLMANEVPIDIVAGKAGGTTIVIRSRARTMMVDKLAPIRTKLYVDAMKPMTAMTAKTPINLNESS